MAKFKVVLERTDTIMKQAELVVEASRTFPGPWRRSPPYF